MIYLALCFCAGSVTASFCSWMYTYGKLLEARRERDEARERLRHATSELEGHADYWRSRRDAELRKLVRASAEYLKSWN